jgi:Flp pilus assembly protein TadG
MYQGLNGRRRRQRGVAMFQGVMVMTTVGVGVAAIAIDTGLMYSARSDLQTAVDAAALAAAAELSSEGDVQAAARGAAASYAERNQVARNGLTIDPNQDVVFGKATVNELTGKYEFAEGVTPYDAVRVSARRDATAADGPVSLVFGHVFGTDTVSIQASAVAMYVPRDIAVVVDLSGSMNDDSELRHYSDYQSEVGGDPRPGVQVNIRDVWAALDGPAPSFPYLPNSPGQTEYAGDTGPSVGAMATWGNLIELGGGYSPVTDPGLVYLPKGGSWLGNEAANAMLTAQGYNSWERWAILSNETEGYLTRERTDSKGFSSRVVNKRINSSRYKITVYLSSDSSGSTPALSHLTIGLPSSARATAASTAQSQGGYSVSIVTPDPRTGVYGIKFDNTALGEGGVAETEWFSFEVPSSSNVDDIVIATKAGSGSQSVTQYFSDVDANNTTRWRYRVATVLGLADWESGMPEAAHPGGGDGDGMVESTSELDYIAYPAFRNGSWDWNNYIDYCRQSNNQMARTDSNFQERFGLKTLVNFVMESYSQASRTELAITPAQPLQAVKDAVQSMKNKIESLDSLDNVSLEIFGTSSNHEIDLTHDLQDVPARLYAMQAGHYNTSTNLGAGLDEAIDELQSERARNGAAKIIIVLTDGKPNCDQWNNYVGDNSPTAINWAVDRAQYAADNRMTIYSVAVGQDANRDITRQIAEIGNGEEFYAEGSPDEYTAQLNAIFETLGGKRPVQLIK